MANRGAKLGNKNAYKGKQIKNALHMALVKYENGTIKRKEALHHIAESLIEKGLEGDLSAISMIADQLDGKPAQAITGLQGESISLVERVIVVQAIEEKGKVIE